MTFNEAAYNILNLLSGGRSTDNEPRTIEQIKFTVLYYRALFARREIEQGTRSYELEQTLWNVPVSAQDPKQVRAPGTLSGESIAKSVVFATPKLPSFLRTKREGGVISVLDSLTGEPIPLTDEAGAFALNASRYVGTRRRAFLRDGKVMTVNHDYKPITVRAIFEDFRKAHNFNQLYQEAADFWDDDLHQIPLPADLYARIVEGLVAGEIKLMSQTSPDMIADQSPDV